MKTREIDSVRVCKREYELYSWLLLGLNAWQDAFYQYPNRRKRVRDSRQIASWFNRTLRGLQGKGLCGTVKFVTAGNPFGWFNPMLDSCGDELKAEVIHLTDGQRTMEAKRPIL